MSKFTKELIKDYADKLLIGLTEEETETILDEFEVIEANMDLINEIDGIKDVPVQDYPFIIEPNIRDGKTISDDTYYPENGNAFILPEEALNLSDNYGLNNTNVIISNTKFFLFIFLPFFILLLR